MTTQPTALLLADALGNLEATGYSSDSVSLTDRSEAIADAAAAELRRLHAQRNALLEACKAYDQWADKTLCYDRELRPIRAQIRAAIKAVEEEA